MLLTMRKIILSFMLALMLIPSQAFAANYGTMYYVPYLDQYRIDYAYNQNDVRYELVFTGDLGNVFTGSYNFPPTGIHYLTCNGEYRMKFYNSVGNIVHTLGPVYTTQIINPTCESYADGVNGADDLNAKATTIGEGNYRITWSSLPDSEKFEIWKDGQKVGTTTGNEFEIGKGSVTVVALDKNGDIIGRSDLIVPKANSDCCQYLSELLECPDWDTYMAELTQAIKNALPTLPGWREIAEQFVDAFDEYFGPVPMPPTVQEIEQILPPMPPLDTAVPEADFDLKVPDDYNNGPLPFDITTGPEIPVIDKSEAFEIYEPNKYIISDPAGEMVLPGDSRNSSQGIKQPDTIRTNYPQPVPSNTPLPTVPPSNMPVPGGGATDLPPIPNSQGGPGPIPTGGNGSLNP